MTGNFLTRGVLPIVLAAFACGQALAAEKVSVRLNWVPGTEHSFLYLAKEKGWFADAGIDLEIIAGQGSTVAVKTVGVGETAFAIADVATVARGWEAGVPIVAAAVLLKESPTVVYSLKAKGITKMPDLCGKKVGLNIKSTTSEQYRAMVRIADLKNCEITEVPISGGGSKEVLSGAVDAAVIFSYEDPAQLMAKGQELNTIPASQFFKLYSLSIITNVDTATRKPALVNSFVKVAIKGIKYALENPEEAKQSFLKLAPEADVAYEKLKFDMFSKLLAGDESRGDEIGKSSAEGWSRSIKVLCDLGIIKTEIDPAGKFVQAQ
jgi:NitT/TauT family transport system substrate-binding protein